MQRTLALTSLITFLIAFQAGAARPAEPPKKPVLGQYKRAHQRVLKQLLSGDFDAARKQLEDILGKDPDDAESHYMLAESYARQGEKQEATTHIEKAIQLGLPAGRFVAGSDSPFRKLAGKESFDIILDAFAHAPVHGPMLGAVTDRSAKIWFRTGQPAEIKISVSSDPDFGDAAASFAARSDKPSDLTAVISIDGLQPRTRYFYRVTINGQQFETPKPLSFQTFAAKDKASKFTIAFGGGAGFVPSNERVWETIASKKPDALLLLGDNTYIDDPKTPEMQRYCYYRRQSRPEFRTLVATTPVYAIWDDHDFGTNDCWGGPEIESPSWKRPVWNIFRQNWVNPSYGGGEKNPGCWYDFMIGDVHFIMLDGRYYRTNPKVDAPSMLGPVQMKWLKERIAKSPGTFKVLVSPVPWTFVAKGKSLDTWNGFQKERTAIFDFLTSQKAEGVLLMSADRHRSDLWKIDRPGDYSLYELNSSRLTNQHVHGTMAAAEFSYNKKQSFGLVDFDTTAADPTFTYRIITIDGEPVFSFTLPQSKLK